MGAERQRPRGAGNVDKSSGTRAKTKKRYPGGTGSTHEDAGAGFMTGDFFAGGIKRREKGGAR